MASSAAKSLTRRIASLYLAYLPHLYLFVSLIGLVFAFTGAFGAHQNATSAFLVNQSASSLNSLFSVSNFMFLFTLATAVTVLTLIVMQHVALRYLLILLAISYIIPAASYMPLLLIVAQAIQNSNVTGVPSVYSMANVTLDSTTAAILTFADIMKNVILAQEILLFTAVAVMIWVKTG